MNKISYKHIMGCVAALTVGAWGENAKAEYTDANTVKLHWEVSKDLFPQVFDDSFQLSDFYWLWSTAFSTNFKQDKGDLYRIRKAAEGVSYHTFHTADELQALQIDAFLKKICKALGSRRFLVEILDEVTVNTVRDRSMQPNRETTVTFDPYYDGETFFDTYGNGRLKMCVCQSSNGNDRGLRCSFSFTFKKEGENVSLTRYEALYSAGGTNMINFRFFQGPQKLPWDRFPTESARQAGLEMNTVYKSLFDNRSNLRSKEHLAVHVNGDEPRKFHKFCFDFPNDTERWKAEEHTFWLLEILPSVDFLEGIFGKETWQMIEKYNRCYRESDIKVEYTVNRLKNGKRWEGNNPDQFEVYLRISDGIACTRKPVFDDYSWNFEYNDFTFIGFRFIFDIQENEILDVKFCDKLRWNGELFTRGETEETTWDLFE